MATTRERRGILILLLFLTMLTLAGGLTAQGADARGRTKVKTTLTIRERVDIQTDNCEIAGGEISVSYAYEDDGSESATTSCSGGLLDGNVCINEATTMECYQVRRVVPTRPLDGISPMMPVNDMELAEPTPNLDAPTAGVGSTPAPVSDGGVVPGEGSRATVDDPLLVGPDGPPIVPLDR